MVTFLQMYKTHTTGDNLTKGKDFHLGPWVLGSKAHFGPEEYGLVCWNWFKMSARVH